VITIRQQPMTEDLKKEIYEGFKHHAVTMTGYNELSDPIAFVANNNNLFAGAIVVQLFWGALHIKNLYIDTSYRHKGLGTRLMEYAFNFGYEKKCSFAFTETMSFQALEFYKKVGFQLEFTRSGYSHGTSFHYLKKEFL
jgi:ribosomal protein S18 acetylase RimI-like enzyme